MKIGLVQLDIVWEHPEKNRKKIHNIIQTQGQSGTDLYVYPELTVDGFTMNPSSVAETLSGESISFFTELAKETNSHQLFGVVIENAGNFYNSLIHVKPDGKLGSVYQKMHPFSFAGEDKVYTPGTELVITEINGVLVGLTICYDLRFPELFRKLTISGAEMIVNIANWPAKRGLHWNRLLPARAIENQVFIVAANRVGTDPSNQYNGESQVIHPNGTIVGSFGNGEGIFFVEIDPEEGRTYRKNFPVLQDIRLI